MRKQLELLRDCLMKNGYQNDSEKNDEIIIDIQNGNPQNAMERLIEMCNPRYLGDLNIAEFDSVYNWWNFLAEISQMAKNQNI